MVVVTGATGFIGRHLVRYLLARGEQVRCLVRRSSDLSVLPLNQIQTIEADLTDSVAMTKVVSGCDVVYHLAALTSALRRESLYRTNAGGCGAVAGACAAAAAATGSAPTLVLVSSIAAVGTAIAGRGRSRQDPARPVSEYGRSKRAGELFAGTFADRVPISIVRPGIVVGTDSRELKPMFDSILRFRIHAVPGYRPRRFALIYVDDLVDILVRVAASGQRVTANPSRTTLSCHAAHDGRGYYYAATEAPTYAELGRMICRAAGTPQPLVLHVPEPLAWLMAGIVDVANRFRGKSENLNIDKMREAFAGDWVGATSNLARDLQFQSNCTLQQRLAECWSPSVIERRKDRFPHSDARRNAVT